MLRFLLSSIKTRSSPFHHSQTQLTKPSDRNRFRPPCDIFISHRSIDTKRTISGLLHDHFFRLGFRPFLDSKSMKPGDRLVDRIDDAIANCKIGLVVFSPNYCDSLFCLHELASIVECKKRVVPIFCDVKPSLLHVKDGMNCTAMELRRFRRALEEAKDTVGIPFDSYTCDWSQFLTNATDAIFRNMLELEDLGNLSTTRSVYLSRASKTQKCIGF